MKKHVLVVHSAGPQGPRQGSAAFVAHLERELGAAYGVLYPKMPDPQNPRYAAWKAALDQKLSALEGRPSILVGHSLGGSVLLKYLSEESCPHGTTGLFVAGAPFWGPGGWQGDEFTLRPDFASRLPDGLRIFLYHSREDAEVPFEHVAIYARELPDATAREVPGSEHEFKHGLPELVEDIKALAVTP